MKYVVVLGDGMADEPIPEIGGRTPLEDARTPGYGRSGVRFGNRTCADHSGGNEARKRYGQ